MRIAEKICLVGGGKWSFGLTHPLDCSIYLIETGEGCIMIDSGCAIETERIEAVMRADGHSIEDVKMLVLTHYHADHACGAAWIHERSGCRVFASAPEADCIAKGDDIASSLAPGRGKSYPADFVYPPCPCVEKLNEGDVIKLGEVELKCFFVPGHSLCDLVLYGEIAGRKCLFSGDAVFAGGEILLQSLYDVSILPYFEGIKKIAGLETDSLFPGHGQFILNGADWHVQKCLEGFESGLVPRQFHFFA